MSKSSKDKSKIAKKEKIAKDHLKELENSYKRALADYSNLKRRYEEDKLNLVKFANEVLIGKLVQVLLDLEGAQKYIKDDGLNKIIEKFAKLLKEEGLEEINPKGKPFDASRHEAIESVDGENNKVVKVLRKGYKLHNKTILTALVAIGNGNERKNHE